MIKRDNQIGLALLWVLSCWTPPLAAQSLMGDGAFFGRTTVETPVSAAAQPGTMQSLFIGRDGTSFFRPFPVRIDRAGKRVELGLQDGPVARLRDLIAEAEAGPAGYDAVVWGARIQPPRPPTQLTLAEIDQWTRATPGQNHAIGRYQFIPATLRRLAARLDLPPDTRFSPAVQDKLANLLLAEAGLDAMVRGDISQRRFMGNLAKIWAGLPTPSGKSHYHGYAGNKATITWARFEGQMRRIFPRG